MSPAIVSASERRGPGRALRFAVGLVAVLAAASVWMPAAGAQQSPPAGEPGVGIDRRPVIGEPAGFALEGEALERATEELSSLMRCPVCQGLSVADSPTDSALSMKGEVRELLAQGYTDEQILAYFEASYGEFIRLEPKPEGFNLVVWLLPLAAVAAGGLLIAWRVRSWRPRPAAAKGGEPELADYLERVRREVSS